MTRTNSTRETTYPTKPRTTQNRSQGMATATKSVRRDSLPVSVSGDVRIGPVLAIPTVLCDLGVAPQGVFRRAGVMLNSFKNPEARIAFEALGCLFLECVAATNYNNFGLLVGGHFRMRDLGAVGYLMSNSATVGEALRALLLHLHLQDRGAIPILLDLEPSKLLLGYSIYRHGIPGVAYIYDVAVAIGYQILIDICGPNWRPLRVQFSHHRPKDIGPYRHFFGVNVQFDAEVSGIAFASSWFDHPVAGADPSLRNLIAAAIKQAQADGGMNFSDEVQAALHQAILGGTSSAENVASFFGIHERTLRKRLTAEGTNFQQLVNQTRFELARQLLENTQLPLSEIAVAMGYADPAVFSRAFRNWAKVSPKQWRAQESPMS